MKQAVIGLLTLANVGLLVALMAGPGTPPAQAQMLGASSNFITTTLSYDQDQQAVCVLDVARRKLAVFRLVPEQQDLRLQEIQGRDLLRDFRD